MNERRGLSILLAFLVTPGCALRATAPMPGDRWAAVVAVPPGTVVRVWWWEAAGRLERAEGALARADHASVEVSIRHGQLRLERAQVRRVDVLLEGDDSVVNGLLTGAAVGAGYGLFVLWRVANEVDNPAMIPVISAGIGAAVGAAIDALRRGRHARTVYRATR